MPLTAKQIRRIVEATRTKHTSFRTVGITVKSGFIRVDGDRIFITDDKGTREI